MSESLRRKNLHLTSSNAFANDFTSIRPLDENDIYWKNPRDIEDASLVSMPFTSSSMCYKPISTTLKRTRDCTYVNT